ncbi:hypothetical protein D3C79_619630 [compost metagenome]
MVGALLVVGQLLDHGTGHIQAAGAGVVEDADHRIGQLYLDRLTVRQVVVHGVFADPLERF